MQLRSQPTKHASPTVIALALIGSLLCPPIFAQDKVDFVKDIKPILSDNCFACHGPDEASRPSDLRLDQKESVFSDLGGYAAIVPGDTEQSELISRILADDDDLVMPPSEHRKKLTQAQKDRLVQWVNQGAPWAKHWSFVAPTKQAAPSNRRVPSRKNIIDDYVWAQLATKELKPSATAPKHTLLRRLNFDLIGLPPSREEAAAFEMTEASYESAVDRLLNSPHFGERMAVYWLDLVRYADSVGYHGDQSVSVTPYRDYVISAFNENIGFDRFTREQIAGDLLENPTATQRIASGYNRLGMMSAEGGVQPEEYLVKYAADRVRTTASVWLGVTLGCAECHDHKFDPFTTKEFYEFASFFSDIKEKGLYSGANNSGNWGPEIEVPDPERDEFLKPIGDQIRQLESKLAPTPEIDKQREQWEFTLQNSKIDWQTLLPTNIESTEEVKFKIRDDHSILVSGENPSENCYIITVKLPSIDVKAIRLEAIPDDSLPKKSSGRAANGNFVVSELFLLKGDQSSQLEAFKDTWNRWPEDNQSLAVRLKNPTATFEQAYGGQAHPDKIWSAASTIDRDEKGKQWGWAILEATERPHELVLQLDESLDSETVTFVIQQFHGNGSHTLGNFRLSVTQQNDAVANPFGSLPAEIQTILNVAPAVRTEAQQKTAHEYYVSVAPEFAQINQELQKQQTLFAETKKKHTRTSLITVAVKPREMRVLARGNWMDKTGEVVTPGVPAALGSEPWEGRGTRLELANWLTSKNNPLTARVFVNRLWRMYFGSGISNVLDDLGSQGEPPSHPELLDRLAVEFVESGWDVKHIVKLMVMSQTYRQSSSLRDDLQVVDPENRLLARQSRFRLDAEFVRDHALQVSGLLNPQVGGRNGKPYQPAGLYRHLNFPKRKYEASQDGSQYRRGLYTHWQRQYLHPAMKTLDAPAREECTAARPRSNTPLAALLLLNDPSYVEAARAFADQAMAATEDQASRIEWIFLSAFSRTPSQEESEVISELLNESTTFYEAHLDEAAKILAIGLSQSPSELPEPERAAWTSVCRAVMNMHEFVLRK